MKRYLKNTQSNITREDCWREKRCILYSTVSAAAVRNKTDALFCIISDKNMRRPKKTQSNLFHKANKWRILYSLSLSMAIVVSVVLMHEWWLTLLYCKLARARCSRDVLMYCQRCGIVAAVADVVLWPHSNSFSYIYIYSLALFNGMDWGKKHGKYFSMLRTLCCCCCLWLLPSIFMNIAVDQPHTMDHQFSFAYPFFFSRLVFVCVAHFQTNIHTFSHVLGRLMSCVVVRVCFSFDDENVSGTIY